MIYKMNNGNPIECRTTIETKTKPFYSEWTAFRSLDVFREATPGEVIVFRARIADRPFTLLAETTFEIVESVRYLKSIGFEFDSIPVAKGSVE